MSNLGRPRLYLFGADDKAGDAEHDRSVVVVETVDDIVVTAKRQGVDEGACQRRMEEHVAPRCTHHSAPETGMRFGV